MDQTQLQQKIAEYYAKLPTKSQEIFSSMKWLETLQEISAKYKLNDKETETLGTETMLVLLGIINLNEYEKILTKEIQIPKYSMDEMIIKIDESILNDIRPELMQTFEKNNTQITEEENIDDKLDHFSQIIDETQKAIEKSNYRTIIYEIGKKYNLTVFQMGILGESVTNILLGKTPSYKFEYSLKQNLKLPEEKNRAIVEEINEKIFKVIREKLIETEEKNTPQNTLDENHEEKIESREELMQAITEEKVEKQVPNYEELELTAPKEPVLNNEKQEDKKIPSILSQKLSGFFQIPKKETDHSIPNITKNPETKNNPPKVDPYREIPE